jgi:hypothetical protein
LSFTRLFGPGFHIEGEGTIFDRRLKGTYMKHFRYFGARGELLIYALTILLMSRFIKRNFERQENIESLFNDRNVYFKVDLPSQYRKIGA